MARETIATTDVEAMPGHLYFVSKGDVWMAPLKKPGQPKGKKVKAAATGVETDYSKYMYFVGRKNGKLIVERTERQVGGSKRAKAKGSAKKGAVKKTAKKAAGKKGKKK
jgi:hypothetical protein